ncbi:MAG: family 16 glycoside hydrolase, partial [Gemmataceae bacterium]
SKGTPGKDPFVLADKPFGEWNHFRIIMVGERVTVWLNDKLVVDHARLENFWKRDEVKKLEAELKKLKANADAAPEDAKKAAQLSAKIQQLRAAPLMRQAPIQLQTHGGEIRWRNMYVREIPSAEANQILSKHGGEGFESVFNGKDLTGWAGPIDQYEVVDGAIVCKPHKGGTIYTKDEYTDFVARVEYKLPPAGNNGLAIRYPGHGDTAYVGMCEVQVLDDTAPGYAKLDPRQYNGSVYGIVAAHRGYMRPVGEWNFEEVTVKGPHIRVELNGTVIVDADVSQVTTYMANSAHPGKDRSGGHFGFAGHNDPVAFRSIFIKKLESK